MGRKKAFLLVAIFLMVSSLSLVSLTSAQSIPKPSVPEFTLRYVDYSYDVPPKYGIDQYTGQNITIQAGYHVDNRSIEVTVKNQPFTPYNDSNGNYIGLYYNFRYKGHYGTQWTYFPFNPDGVTATPWNGMIISRGVFPYFTQSEAANTTFIFGVHEGQEDFEVQAQIGHIADVGGGTVSLGSYYKFTGVSSDWSPTQTVTILESNNPTPTLSPTVPELSWLAIVPLLLLVFAVAVVISHRKTANLKQ